MAMVGSDIKWMWWALTSLILSIATFAIAVVFRTITFRRNEARLATSKDETLGQRFGKSKMCRIDALDSKEG
jgi:hypothetical protein